MGERNESLQDFIQRLMRERDWAQADFARAVSVSPSQVSRWLSGTSRPKREVCIQIARLFDYHPNYVLAIAGHDVQLTTDIDLSDPLTSFAAANHDRLTAEQKRLLISMAKQFMNEGRQS